MPRLKLQDGTQLNFEDWGQGRPVVLIHGWPLSGAMWEHQAVALAESGCRVIAYDRRGFGRSSHPWSGYDYDTLSGDLAGLIEALELRDVGLAGFSMGGGEVLRYLTRYGALKRVSRVALVSSVTPLLRHAPDNPKGVAAETFQDMIEQLRDDRPRFLGEFSKQFYGVGLLSSPVSDERLQADFQVAMCASPKATVECVTAFSDTDFRADLAALADLPTLVVHGHEDKTVPIDPTARALKAAVPSVQLVEYEGAPHGLFITDRRRLCRDLVGFFTASSAA
ncbi:MAG: alpha/beta hydrolase [Polyangiales bacterium]